LLLGEAGLGKTLTTYLWVEQLLEQWWGHMNDTTASPTYFPLFIRPTVGQWSHKSIKGAFIEAVKKYNLKDMNCSLMKPRLIWSITWD